MDPTVDIVEFVLGGERYALELQLATEIVEIIPITPIPRAPAYISGLINLRGEITNIMNLNTLLGLPTRKYDTPRRLSSWCRRQRPAAMSGL